MERNVILTTMSVLPIPRRKNYYYDSASSRYCEGIAQTEPGTKLLLSGEVKIDEIIAIGSDETFSPSDGLDPVNVMEYYKQHGDDSDADEDVSAFAFYRSRICRFCANGDRPEAETEVKPRVLELNELVNTYMKEACPGADNGSWLGIIANDEREVKARGKKTHSEIIEEILRNNIINTADYTHYHIDEIEFDNKEYSDSDIDALIEEISGEEKTTLEKEAILRSLQEQIYSIAPASAEYYKGVLTEKIKSLQNKRLVEEISYIKGYLFSLVPPEKRLMRKGQIDLSQLMIRFIPERVDVNGVKTDNIVSIVNAIWGGADTVNLYVDTQGGFRTDAYVRNAIISILTADTSKNFNLRKLIYTNFNQKYYSSAIMDETSKYGITDLVAGMNAFIQYGRADIIKRYCDNIYGKESQISNLVNEMVSIDQALSICDIEAFSHSLMSIRKFFPPHGITTDPVFTLMEQLISNEYKGIIDDSGNADYVKMCEWALKKKFVQQALTIIESKFPYEIVRNGICYYDETNVLSYMHNQYNEARRNEQYKFSNSAYYYIKCYTTPGPVRNAIREGAGHNHLGSSQRERNLLQYYKNVSDRRNDINHAWLSSRPGEIRQSYEQCRTLCTLFLEAYDACIKEIQNKKIKFDIRIYSKEEIINYEELEQVNTERTLESSVPVNLDLTYSAYFIAAIKPSQAGKVKDEIGRTMGLHTVTGYEGSLKKIDKYMLLPADDKNLQGLLRMIKEEADEKKKTLTNAVLFIDEEVYGLAIKCSREDIIDGFDGCVFLGRNGQNEWHTIEKL